MDYSKVFKDSARLIWRHKLLLILGLLLVSSSVPGLVFGHLYSRLILNSFTGFSSTADPGDAISPLADFFINPNLPLIFGSTIGIFFVFVLIWILATLGEISLIRGVADYDDGRSRSLGELLSEGTKLLVRIIAIDTVIFLPLFLILLLQLLIAAGGLIGGILFLSQPGSTPDDFLPAAVIIGLILLFLTVLLIPVIVLTMMFRVVAFRSAILEDLRTRPSIRRAWTLIQAKLSHIIIVALLLYAISYAIGIVTSLLITPISFGGMFIMLRAMAAGQPPQAAELDGFLTLISLASVVGILPNLIYRVYSSAVWTLVYRQWQSKP